MNKRKEVSRCQKWKDCRESLVREGWRRRIVTLSIGGRFHTTDKLPAQSQMVIRNVPAERNRDHFRKNHQHVANLEREGGMTYWGRNGVGPS